MTATPLRMMALAAALTLTGWSTLAAQANPCALLTSAEVTRLVARGQPMYRQSFDAMVVGGGTGTLCDYPHGQVGLWRAPNAEQNLERFFRSWKADLGTRHPVPGVGDKAWIVFPARENQYKHRATYLVAHVGQQIVTVALFARDGAADGPMGEICRGDQSRLKPREQEQCKKALADKGETQESLRPAVVELGKLLVDRVRAGKGS